MARLFTLIKALCLVLLASLGMFPRAALAAIETRVARDRVLLLHEEGQDLLIRELVTRVRGELVAAGFVVDVLAETDIVEPRARAESAAEDDALATFVILRDVERGSLEVWLHDRLTHKTTVRSLRIRGSDNKDHRAGVLAVRVVELLRASLLELIAHTENPPPPQMSQPTPKVTQWVETAALPPAHVQTLIVHAEIGIALLQGLDQVQASLVPRVALQVGFRPGWSARLVAAGFGTRPAVDAPAGAARLEQSLALAEALWCLRLSTQGCLSFSAGGGVFRTQAHGDAISPYVSRNPSSWSGAVSAGIGLSWNLPWRFNIGIRTQGLFLWPQPLVRIAGVVAGRVGRPSLLTGVDLALQF